MLSFKDMYVDVKPVYYVLKISTPFLTLSLALANNLLVPQNKFLQSLSHLIATCYHETHFEI